MAMASLEKELASADKEVLVEIVKLVQKLGLEGASGGWKDFLKCYDRQFGSFLSDPAKRSTVDLIAFLETFTQEEDTKFFAKVMRRYKNHKSAERLIKDFPDCESAQQRLVRLTRQHPQYMHYYSFPSYNEEWMVVPLGKVSKALKSSDMIAIDCEMVLCQDGTEAVVKVCAVDPNLEVKLDKLVNPNKAVADYRSTITGISSKDLEGVTCSLVDIQKSLKKLLVHGTILVGHSLYNDLQALKVDHARVIDTAYIFKYMDNDTYYRPSLNNLCKYVLGSEVRKKGDPHNCLDDARATMKLVLAKLEHGFDNPIAVAGKNVPEMDIGKLLLHRISIGVPTQELLQLFSKEYNVNIQPELRIRGQKYSTFAVFKDSRDADKAFGEIEGQENKDSRGRLQKMVSLKLTTGQTTSFYICRVLPDFNNGDTSKKRLAENESAKRQRTYLHQCDHVKEIKSLKQELADHVKEIKSLKQGLADCVKEIGTLKEELHPSNHFKAIEKFKQELRHKDEKIFNLQRVVAAKIPKETRKVVTL